MRERRRIIARTVKQITNTFRYDTLAYIICVSMPIIIIYIRRTRYKKKKKKPNRLNVL